MDSRTKLKCDRCRKRTLGTVAADWDPMVVDLRSVRRPRTVDVQVSGSPKDGVMAETRWSFRCHPDCGASVTVRGSTLADAIDRARASGKNKIWAPSDFHGGKVDPHGLTVDASVVV